MTEFEEQTIRRIHILDARRMAHDMLFNVVFRFWGAPTGEVMAYLDQCIERAEATGLHVARPEAELDAIRQTLQAARLALQSRVAETP